MSWVLAVGLALGAFVAMAALFRLPRHPERERAQREGSQRQGDRQQPGHRARPSRRHRISPTSTTSTSGIANSGQVVELTVGL